MIWSQAKRISNKNKMIFHRKVLEIKSQERKKFMAGNMVFIINFFDEIVDHEVPASLLHGVFNFSDFDFWDQKT